MMMEKSWVMMMHQTDKEHEEQEEVCSTSDMWHAKKQFMIETAVNWWFKNIQSI